MTAIDYNSQVIIDLNKLLEIKIFEEAQNEIQNGIKLI